MGSDAWAQVSQIAQDQHGVISVAQVRDLGLDRRYLNRAVATGRLAQVHPNVFRFVAAAESPVQGIHAAVLQVEGSTASHESALWLQKVPRIPLVAAVTIAPGSGSIQRTIRVHRFGDLAPEHCVSIDGVDTTTLPRAIVDVASIFSMKRLEYVVDQVTITDRSTSVGAIARVLRQVNRRGRRNIATLQQILDDRRPAEIAPRSRVERRADELIDASELPRPVPEYPLPSLDPGRGFVDRAWPEARLILEVDGRAWHAREAAMAKDRSRDRAAAREGWLTLRVLHEELDSTPDAVIGDVLATYRSRIPSPLVR